MGIALGASDLEDQPILVDRFLAEATECDVDVVADFGNEGGGRAIVAGVMEHIEEAGIHSGDSACTIPPHSLPEDVVEQLREQSCRIAESLNVCGLMNIQYAIRKNDNGEHEIFVLEVNPRASRTVPFVSKATGLSWANVAAKVMAGETLNSLGIEASPDPAHTSVKESVFPFNKFPGVDVILGPEMRSTGEVMGADPDPAVAFGKAQMGAGTHLPTEGTVFLSVRRSDKEAVVPIARELVDLGFKLICTDGTHRHLAEHDIPSERINKISEGRPNAIDLVKNQDLDLIINTPTRKGLESDEGRIRATAVRFQVPMITTLTGGAAAVKAIAAMRDGNWTVRALQDYQTAAVVTQA
ncbi:MAG: carbamoyl phosphate synthase large subunit, partial [Phycisphaeraceae bacterium]|nr:carbamoyl phosphate synthase large subunit [Phycisphaeraceae bacterium]